LFHDRNVNMRPLGPRRPRLKVATLALAFVDSGPDEKVRLLQAGNGRIMGHGGLDGA